MASEDNTFVIRGPTPAEPLSKKTLGEEILHSLLQNKPDDDAMIDAVTGEALSRRSLLQAACNTATALQRCGCTKGTVISICSENSLQFFTPVLASLFTGCIVAPVNHSYTSEELEHSLDISKPKIIFCSREVLPKFTELKRKRDHIEKVIAIDCNETLAGAETMETFIERALMGQRVIPENFQPLTDDPAKLGAFILCSSGTTGMPKGVLLSHFNVLVRVAHTRDPRYKFDVEKSMLGLMPFFHGYGLIVSLCSIINSDQLVVLKKFDEDVFLRALQDYKISFLPLAPPLAIFLKKSPKVLEYDLSHVKSIVCGAAPLSKDTELGLKKRLKSLECIQQAYGLTEATLAVTLLDRKTVRSGSSGRVASYMSCKVRDPETGKSLGPNQVGELCFKGPMLMMGYYNDEKATRESFTSDGWLKTGDLGYYDDEGYFYIVDRLKELIKYKGFQVAPAELEAILLTHPKVRDAGVVGLPDELAGELPLAFVVKRDGAEISEQELQKFVARVVSPQKRLRGGVIFVSEIPKNPSGKILRRVLRQRLKNYKAKQESKL